MPVATRTALDALPAYKPGRRPDELARELGVRQAVKLASNEMAFGPLPSVVDAVQAAVAGANRYPDMRSTELTAALARRFDVEPDRVAVGCGSVALCRHLVEIMVDPGQRVAYGWPTFDVYGSAAVIAGGGAITVPMVDHRLDVDALADAVTAETRVVVVCNPNNPTGTVSTREELERLIARVPSDVLIVLDEAYLHFVTDERVPDGLELARAHDNVAVLRTFSKAYGLAGLRAGFCVAAPEVATALRKVIMPFSVSAPAQAAAVASLTPEAEGELRARVAAVVTERDRVTAALRELGADVPESQANFVWLPLAEASASFAADCESAGVILRAYPGMGVRVTVGTPGENDLFLKAARELL
ncbi:MAG TPA: histidinol-phosphate transaminase [Streptosporangiaceae bacterium]|jgi:histidinol-phosphate aminotransferase